MLTERKRLDRGFVAKNCEKRREIGRKGGLSVPAEKRAFSQNHQLAVNAAKRAAACTSAARLDPADESPWNAARSHSHSSRSRTYGLWSACWQTSLYYRGESTRQRMAEVRAHFCRFI